MIGFALLSDCVQLCLKFVVHNQEGWYRDTERHDGIFEKFLMLVNILHICANSAVNHAEETDFQKGRNQLLVCL